MKKTKIICTMGPACDDEEILLKMMDAGMDVARLNFSHGTHEEHLERIKRLKRVRERAGRALAIMVDTKGPEYRIGTFENSDITLKEGSTFTFTTDDVIGDETRVSVSYKKLHEEMVPGDKVLVNNGLLEFTVTEVKGHDIICRVEIGGKISNRKSMSFPDKVLQQAYLSEQDKADLLFAIENEVDMIACSFVSCKQDLKDVIEFLVPHATYFVDLIAKIENRSGIDNIEEICESCTGIMLGRGDMGVEVPYEEVPNIQKDLITKCRLIGQRVITATEMMESMITNPRPTRAEISDVANAVYDGTCAVMLSGETAIGKYPVEVVKSMAKIVGMAEKSIDYKERFHQTKFMIHNDLDAISHSVCNMAIDLNAKAIVVHSHSGLTVRMISRFCPPVDIIGASINAYYSDTLALCWGVIPVPSPEVRDQDELYEKMKKLAIEKLNLQPGDKVVMTGGVLGVMGSTNSIRVETV